MTPWPPADGTAPHRARPTDDPARTSALQRLVRPSSNGLIG